MVRKKAHFFVVPFFILVLIFLNGSGKKPSESFIYRHLDSLSWYTSPDGKTTIQLWRGPELGDSQDLHIGELRMKKGAYVKRHKHDTSKEVLIVLEGSGILTIQGKEVHVDAPAVLEIPKQTEHDFRVTSETRVRAIQIYLPAGPEHRFTLWKKVKAN